MIKIDLRSYDKILLLNNTVQNNGYISPLLQFWFCRDQRIALPLVSIPFHYVNNNYYDDYIYDEFFDELHEYGYFALLPKDMMNIIRIEVGNNITQLYK